MKSHATPLRRRKSGFALLITITLLAFLVLLLVSLAALTRVETQVASNNQQLSQARQNALMGLNIALGKLQAAAGPDQRITATADILSSRHIDKKNWTGVWNASAPGADKNIAWLVSGNPAAGSTTVDTGLPADGSGLVSLVGAHSTDIAIAGNEIKVPTETITSDAVPGMSGQQPVGHFAYWVGDEGVKAKVSVVDAWNHQATREATLTETTPEQAQAYRFVNSQRFGIEGIDRGDGTVLDTAFPGASDDTTVRDNFNARLVKLNALEQLPLTNPSASPALLAAQKNRFHDLTAHASSLLTDVAAGGFKRDLTTWLADTTEPSNPVSALAGDDYITPGDPDDTSKFGLPKWQMIRSYASTRSDQGPLPPRRQTATVQGIHPVVTYARMGFNISCDVPGTAPKLHLMPVAALWNPNNVAIARGTPYELCFAYTCFSPQANPAQAWSTNNTLNVGITNGAVLAADYFYVNRIMNGGVHYGTGTGPAVSAPTEFYRFRLVLDRDLGPGESRLFTIKDSGLEPYTDGSIYSSGNSLMSDVTVADDNSVYIPRTVPYTTVHLTNNLNVYTLPESTSSHARLEVLLTPPLSAASPAVPPTDIPAVNAWLRENAYQRILGPAFSFVENAYGVMVPVQNTRDPIIYFRIELMMSETKTTYPDARSMGNNMNSPGIPGAPRWLATLNPQASISLRKPIVEGGATTRSGFNPSYTTEYFMKGGSSNPSFIRQEIPNAAAGTTNVSAGNQVSVTTAQAQNFILREFPSANSKLFSLAQLQHVNVSTLNINPAYAIGNSVANLYVDRAHLNAWRDNLPSDSFATVTPETAFPDQNTFTRIYDLSYHLNKSLWDSYYFSTIPRDALDLDLARNPAYRLPNNRHRFYWPNGAPTATDIDALRGVPLSSETRLRLTSPASRLLIDGGFNVNSTSEQAWRALLHSRNGIVPTVTAPPEEPKRHLFSRFASVATGATPNDTYYGYRILSDSEIRDLAQKIVAEVRSRGPFLSLADFVNRRLTALDPGIKGALQAAIDNSSANGRAPFTYAANPPISDIRYSASIYPRDIDPPFAEPEQRINYTGGTDMNAVSASRAAFSPGYLTQADLLTSIGASLTARSDTFRIRSYGDAVNPTTGEVSGRAWCEAVVQRLPEYLLPAASGGDSPEVSPPTHPTNVNFGRRFKVIAFRWLSPDDI